MLTGAEVTLLDKTGFRLPSRPATQTNEAGRFRFDLVPEGAYLLDIAYVYATETGPVKYELRTARFKVTDQPPQLAIGLSRPGAMLELAISETSTLVPLEEEVRVRRMMLAPQVKLNQRGTQMHALRVLSTSVSRLP